MKRQLALCALCIEFLLCNAQVPQTGEAIFTYMPPAAPETGIGNSKKETYSVAIRLADATLSGAKVSRIEVPLPGGENCVDPSGWISAELATNGSYNAPDIVSQNGSIQDGMLVVEFDKPYVLTREPVYVGYTFTVNILDDENCHPIVGTAKYISPDGYYVQSSKTVKRWKNYSEAQNFTSAMKVILTMDRYAVAVTPSVNSELDLLSGKELEFELGLTNYGYEPLESISYTYSVGDFVGKGKLDFKEPMEFPLGMPWKTPVSVWTDIPHGFYDFNLTITEVNGKENMADEKSLSTPLNIWSHVPVHRPLMEEYTGLWCGYCPIGLAALERMSTLYPDDFIAASYHNSDVMEVMSQNDFPSIFSGYPNSFIDRKEPLNPFYGSAPSGFGIEQDWLDARTEITPVDIHVQAELSNGSLSATSSILFVKPMNQNLSLEFILLADGLHNARWEQMNHFAGGSPSLYDNIPEMEQFLKKGSETVYDYVYNDVVVATSRLLADPISLGPDIKPETEILKTFDFDVEGIRNTRGNEFITDACGFKVVALIRNADNRIVNAAVCRLKSSIYEGVAEDSNEISAEYYTINGFKTDRPSRGLFIKKIMTSKGVRYLKVRI